MDKAIEICKEMFQYRGYTLSHEEKSEEHYVLTGMDEKGERVRVYILTTGKLNMDTIRRYYTLFKQEGLRHVLLVYDNTATVSVKRLIQTVDIRIELFHLTELQYNIMKHVLVPEHIRVRTSVENSQKYPILKQTDPVARFMGFQKGDIIQINRRNGSVSYRYTD